MKTQETKPFQELTACPKCNQSLKKKDGMFFLREAGMMPGLVCEPCKFLFESKEWDDALEARVKRKKYG